MDKEFIKLAEKIIDEKGRDILLDSRLTKALFMDYGKSEFKNEINLLVKIIELKYIEKIMSSDNLEIIRMILARQLADENFINEKIANSIILLLIGLLRDKRYISKIDENKNNANIEIDIYKKKAIADLMATLKIIMLKKLDIKIMVTM